MHIIVQDTVLPVLLHIIDYLGGIPGFQKTSYSVRMMGITMKKSYYKFEYQRKK